MAISYPGAMLNIMVKVFVGQIFKLGNDLPFYTDKGSSDLGFKKRPTYFFDVSGK